MKRLSTPRFVKTGVTLLVALAFVGVLRVIGSFKNPHANLESIASKAFQQGQQVASEDAREQGFEEGTRAAIAPSIGDSQRIAGVALGESLEAAEYVLLQFVCARKTRYLATAEALSLEQGVNPIVWLENQLRKQVGDFKDLTVRYGYLTASAEQHQASINSVVNHLAIIQAINDLKQKKSSRCTVDLTPAYTATSSYLFESQRANSQRRESLVAVEDEQEEVDGDF